MSEFEWHVLSECVDEEACPIHGLYDPSKFATGGSVSSPEDGGTRT